MAEWRTNVNDCINWLYSERAKMDARLQKISDDFDKYKSATDAKIKALTDENTALDQKIADLQGQVVSDADLQAVSQKIEDATAAVS